ncbi:DUF4886 domain-containing protein [Sphingobacterium faecale]|uniref:DUF4886 domain-containing protein n=1 Tax=Sphingobacterium faecale TaxID=2803775 RepID=A0ABS1RAB5_9SPHI|nr:DUF4886 domain-containing protein [Sphingobacterium faecale]MBL1411174.1 DUF4886 domain-containing protein [Sphingobacterium faecale]
MMNIRKIGIKILWSILILTTGLSSCQKMERPEMSYIPDPPDDGTIRILAIGNSFSEDAVENYLYDLAKAEGKQVIIGNLFIGDASLAQHAENIAKNAAVYSYRKIDKDGKKTTIANQTIANTLANEKWTHISFQQVSSQSGMYDSWAADLKKVYNYVAPRAGHPNVKFLLHQTWAYANNSTHTGFDNYGKNQLTMYNAIVEAVNKAKSLVPITMIIPTGTAIQNGRTSVVEDNFTRDGYHLAIPLGRYTAACTWFEAIFDKSVVGNNFKPEGLSPFEISIAQNAAHMAITNPDKITEMTDFQGGTSGPLNSAVLLDFGNTTASPKWNQINNFLAGTAINLKDSLGSYVGIKLLINERFNGVNNDGPATTSTSLDMPTNVSKSSYFGNSKAPFNNMTIIQSTFDITGLDKNRTYNIAFFGSRGGVNDNRETKYICKGANEVIVRLNTSSNADKIVTANAIIPDTAGKIKVTVTAGENNNNGSGFYYITAARLSSNN